MYGRGKGKSSGKQAVSKSSKAGLQFPGGRVARSLKKGRYAGEFRLAVVVYLRGAGLYVQWDERMLVLTMTINFRVSDFVFLLYCFYCRAHW